jgi:hypothetical protein
MPPIKERREMRPSLLFFTVLLGLLSGCDENPPYRSIPVSPDFVANGVYILHEGSFGDPTGARLSVYDIDADTVYHDIFEAANGGAHLGSLGDDIEIVNGVAYRTRCILGRFLTTCLSIRSEGRSILHDSSHHRFS